MTTCKPTIKVALGQTWVNPDPRGFDHKVRIIEVDDSRAMVQAIDGGRKSRVLYDQYGLRGYQLVSQPKEN